MHDIVMPEVAKSGGILTVRKWLKQQGEAVAKGDTIAQVEGEQGLVELEAGVAGVLVEIAVPAGRSAKAGIVIGMVSSSGGSRVTATTETVKPQGMRNTASAATTNVEAIPVLMPAAGNSMEEGTIVKWRVKEGDRITKGQVIFEVETDKATMEVEATEAGRLAKIVVGEGQIQKVKEAVAYLSEGEVNVGGSGESRVTATTETEKAQGTSNAASAATTNVEATPVLMPAAGNSMEEGTIVKWRVNEGDRITKGQVIFEVETDKATMEVEATEAGRLAKIVVGEGQAQKVKEPVAYLSEGEVNVASAPKKEEPQRSQKTQREELALPVSVPATSVLSAANSFSGSLKASPAARKIAKEQGLDLSAVGVGSGPGGRILSTDMAKVSSRAGRPVTAAKNAASAGTTSADAKTIAPVTTLAATEVVRKKMTKMRKAIAANLQASKQTIPHFYLRATVNADALMAFYKGEKAKYPCSVNDVVTLACAKAIIEFPAFRSKIDKDEIVEYPTVNIGVAVGVEDGLTVPVLLNAHTLTLQQISANTKRIADNARAGKLEGYGQGNFTITNLGMFGVEEFAAIVNPPEPAILAVGAAREAVIVRDGAMKAGRVMTMTLSCDHRLIDGLLAAKFMARLKELIENPTVLI